MNKLTYEVEAALESNHWWFKGRRKLFASHLNAVNLSRDARILDIGTSTGTNLRMLKELGFTQITGLDFSEEAIRFCAEKKLGTVMQGDICALPFPDQSFRFVLATDIIEHVDDDLLAAKEVFRVLEAGGQALFTVPAFMSLWSVQDTVSQHKRRYRSKQLLELIKASGFQIEKQFYFNYLLFSPIWFTRQLIKLLSLPVKNENLLTPSWINTILTAFFTLDVLTAEQMNAPFGVSVFCLARKAVD